jgi:hypothetical protein
MKKNSLKQHSKSPLWEKSVNNNRKLIEQNHKVDRELNFLLSKPYTKLQNSWFDFLKKRKFDYFITLTANFPINKYHLAKNLEVYFRNILALTPRTNRGNFRVSIEFYYSIERNPSGDGGYHAHGLLKVPTSISVALLDRIWLKIMNNGKSNKRHQNRIEPIRNISNVSLYNIKKIGSDSNMYEYLSSKMYSSKNIMSAYPSEKMFSKN